MSETANKQEQWDSRYETGDLPWDSGRHDRSLEAVIAEQGLAPCRALELGCGTGTNAIWLAERGFIVTALDISPRAIAAAQRKASAAGVAVEFLEADLHDDHPPQGAFDFVFDRGCFHSPGDEERDRFASYVHAALRPTGLWFSLVGSADTPPRQDGPPQLTVQEVAALVESMFEIVSLKATHFDSDQDDPPAAWACLMRKRKGV